MTEALGEAVIMGEGVGFKITCGVGIGDGFGEDAANLWLNMTEYPAITTKTKIITTIVTFRFIILEVSIGSRVKLSKS